MTIHIMEYDVHHACTIGIGWMFAEVSYSATCQRIDVGQGRNLTLQGINQLPKEILLNLYILYKYKC